MGTSKFIGVKQLSYQLARNEIKTGDLLFCSGSHILSELIKKMSDSMFSHVALLCYWNDRVVVLESVEDDGVRAVPLSHYLYNYENSMKKYNGEMYLARHDEVGNPYFDSGKINRMLGNAVDMLNRNYDKDEIARIVARVGLGVGKHKDDKAYICSEFVDECFKQMGIKFLRDAKGFIFPEHIAADSKVRPLFKIQP